MSTWQWQPGSGSAVDGTLKHYTIRSDVDAAYDDAERLHAMGLRVHILLSPDRGVGVADTRDPGGEWIVGRERWRANAQRAAS